jgi:hypothetical protein
MTRGGSFGAAALMKMSLMPLREGIDHILAELSAGAPESEILTTDGTYHTRFYPQQLVVGAESPTPRAEQPSPRGPMIARAAPDRSSAEIDLDPVEDPFLRQHRLKGRPVLPLVIAMESMLEAWAVRSASESGPGAGRASLRDVRVVRPLRFFTDQPLRARVRLQPQEDGAPTGLPLKLTADFFNLRGQLVEPDRVHFEAIAEPAADQPRHLVASDSPPALRKVWYPEDDRVLYHGPVFRLLNEVHIGALDAWGKIVARPPAELSGTRPQEGWRISPAVVDAALFACGVYLFIHIRGSVSVPASIDRFDAFEQPRAGEQVIARLVARSVEQARACFDIGLFGEDGRVLYEIEGYRSTIIPGTVQ